MCGLQHQAYRRVRARPCIAGPSCHIRDDSMKATSSHIKRTAVCCIFLGTRRHGCNLVLLRGPRAITVTLCTSASCICLAGTWLFRALGVATAEALAEAEPTIPVSWRNTVRAMLPSPMHPRVLAEDPKHDWWRDLFH